jgi:copper homeostasis protein
MNAKLEVIGFTIEGCVLAEEAGAHRIELCDNPGEGGTTASYGFIKAAREKLRIDLFPIIRPRGGDFLYSEDEFDIMKADIKVCKQLGCDGVVIGMLTKENKVDKKRCGALVDLAYPLGVTFHRAFDRTADAFAAMEDIINIGCERILTSGQKPTASEGTELINQLIKKAGERIIIMPGSGVKADNIASIARSTGATEFHSSARVQNENKISVDKNEVEKMLQQLSRL